jgi:hypothetical protein
MLPEINGAPPPVCDAATELADPDADGESGTPAFEPWIPPALLAALASGVLVTASTVHWPASVR